MLYVDMHFATVLRNLAINCQVAAPSFLHFKLKGRAKGKTLLIQ